jgi:hypothetical protein
MSSATWVLLILLLLTAAETVDAADDLQGVWLLQRAHGASTAAAAGSTQLTAAGKEAYLRNQRAAARHDASVDTLQRCASPGMPRIELLRYPFQIVQQPDSVIAIFEWNHLFRQIALDGRRDPYTMASPMGYSDAHWEGDVLVVTTTDRDGSTWLDNTGLPHGEQLKLLERLRLTNHRNTLEDRITVEDPEYYAKPWEFVLHFDRQRNGTITEDVCQDRVAAGRSAVEDQRLRTRPGAH